MNRRVEDVNFADQTPPNPVRKPQFNSITSFASRIFAEYNKFLKCPSKFFGAKTWSIPGIIFRSIQALYNRILKKNQTGSLKTEIFGINKHYKEKLKELSPEKTNSYMPHVHAAATVHNGDLKWIKPFGYDLLKPSQLNIVLDGPLQGIQIKDSCFFDPNTGLKVMLLEKNDEIIIVFGALGSSEKELHDKKQSDLLSKKMAFIGTANIVGFNPFIYNEADLLIEKLMAKSSINEKKVTLVGQCFGGSLASYAGLKQGVRAVCFNTLGLGASLQHEIGEEKLAKANKVVTHISAKTDYVSDPNIVVTCADKILNLLGIKTAGNFGKHYVIPSAYTKRHETHTFMNGSMMKHVGLHYRTEPSAVPKMHEMFQESKKTI